MEQMADWGESWVPRLRTRTRVSFSRPRHVGTRTSTQAWPPNPLPPFFGALLLAIIM